MIERKMIETKSQKEMTLWDITLGEMMKESAATVGDHEMIKYTDRDYTRSYRQFDEETDLIARAFIALGVQKGDNIAMWAGNTPEWIVSLYAAAKVGAVLVTVNTSYKVFEVEYLLRQSDTKILIMSNSFKDTDYSDIINKLCPALKSSHIGEFVDPMLPRLELVINTSEIDYPGMLNFKRLYDIGLSVSAQELEERAAMVNSDDIVNMQYTSGTTGFPKGVMLTHKNIINNGRFIGDAMKFTMDDRLCIHVPFFHCFGLVLGMMAAFTHNTTVIPIEAFSPSRSLKVLSDEKCTAVHGVPTMFIAMMEHEDFKNYKFTNLRTGIMAGSPCPVKVMQQVVDEMGMSQITIVFGQTESSPGCTQTTTDDSIDIRVSTVGRALPFTECKIVDPETNEQLPDGISG
ncbi:MAG: AMP-binding protein, partial [Oscillospiraceae bacterium]|nr:AMP-binding protein [Oscillospiraceae bacterium]